MGNFLGFIIHLLLSGLFAFIFVKVLQKIYNYNVSNKRIARASVISFLMYFSLSILGLIICVFYLIILAIITPKSNTGSPNLSAPDELRKWKQLMDEEVISPEEYEQKKRDVLNDKY